MRTLWISSRTNIPTEQNNAMTKVRAFFGGQNLAKLTLNLFRVLGAVGQTESAADADTMGIADNAAGDSIQITK